MSMNFASMKNSRKQGDAGLGVAIGWFSSNGWTVCLPLTDSQDYDLVVDKNKRLYKVQVKTTRAQSKYNVYEVCLKTSGGNKTGTGKTKMFDQSSCSYLFVVTDASDKYLIPTRSVKGKTMISLGKNYRKYLLS